MADPSQTGAWHSRPELDLPLSRLSFLAGVVPTTLGSVVTTLREKHRAGAPERRLTVAAVAPTPSEHNIQQFLLINELADLTDEDPRLTKGLAAEMKGMLEMRNIARGFSHGRMAQLMQDLPSGTSDSQVQRLGLRARSMESQPSEIPEAVVALQRKLFHRHASAVVARMVQDREIVIGSRAAANGDEEPVDEVISFLDKNPGFDIRSQSLVVHLNETQKSLKEPVARALKTIQTMQALTDTPEALPALSQAGMTSSLVVSQIPQKTFVSSLGKDLGGHEAAAAIHSHATTIATRNAMALSSILHEARGSGVAMVDGAMTRTQLISQAKEVMSKEKERVNLENLFGTMDVCECDDCNSVTSPAAYFVELLQYLRNNNLDPNSVFMDPQTGDKKGREGYDPKSPLGVLLSRRPDLACLDLSCANTTTVLPYIDLANEVMESFVVHLEEYESASPEPGNPKQKQAIIDVYNADPDATEGLGGSSAELLAKPQNTNDKSYCILANAVYPSTKLPFNQPVAFIRLFLEFLGTSRADLGERFIGKYTPPTAVIVERQSSTAQIQSKAPKKTRTSDPYRPRGCGWGSDSDCSTEHDSCDEEDDGSNTSPADEPEKGDAISADDQNCLVKLHDLALQRSMDAERLLLTQEEYIILTREAFWQKKHFEIRHGRSFTDEEYRTKIGVHKGWEYWGVDYTSVDDMLSQVENQGTGTGLTFVKDQFLPRSGITYAELVDLLRTEFINPKMLKGRNKVIMEAFRLSYTFMKTKVGKGRGKERFCKLVEFIDSPAWHRRLKEFNETDVMAFFDEDDDDCCADKGKGKGKEICRHHHPHHCSCKRRKRMLKWLCTYFDRIGKIIVLESLISPFQLPWEAKLVVRLPTTPPPDTGSDPVIILRSDQEVPLQEEVVGLMKMDRTIIEWDSATDEIPSGKVIGRVDLDGSIYSVKTTEDGVEVSMPWSSVYPDISGLPNSTEVRRVTYVLTLAGDPLGEIDEDSKFKVDGEKDGQVPWMGLNDDCDISRDRLRHLDGTSLCEEEYDKIHRFLRLWRKLGWTMVELDEALRVLGMPKPLPPICDPLTEPTTPPTDLPEPALPDEDVGWVDFSRACSNGKCGDEDCGCGSHKPPVMPGGKTEDPNACACRHRGYRHHCHPKPKKPVVQPSPIISPDFLHQLVALKKLADLTGLDIINLLALYGTISIAGTPSLYSRLFLTHNLLGVDRVFKEDEDDNYLTASPPEKVGDHQPILLAAFQLKIKDFNEIVANSEIIPGGLLADLTLENVSRLYRYVLLGRVMKAKPAQIPSIFETLGFKGDTKSALLSAANTVKLVELWESVPEAGFTFAQLNFLLKGTEVDQLKPVGPTETIVLRATMTIYTGLGGIDAEHPDIGAGLDTENTETEALAKATSALVLQNAQLIFDSDFSTKITAFLDGSLVFSTSAPPGLVITIPQADKALTAKVKYADGAPASLQITGQLTDDEKQRAIALSAHDGWAKAINRCANQTKTFLRQLLLSGVFPADQEEESKKRLLIGDVPPTNDPDTPPNPGTGPSKRLYFLTWFIPFLRRKLADKLVIDTMSSAASLEALVAGALLQDIIVDPTDATGKTSALKALQSIKNDSAAPIDGFDGFLVPPTTDRYILIGEVDLRPSLQLDGQSIEMRSANADGTDDGEPNIWATDPMTLTGGQLYKTTLRGVPPGCFKWKTERSLPTTVPASALLANHVTGALRSIFDVVYKCAMVINGFTLTLDEVAHVWKHGADFGTNDAFFNWNAITLPMWERLRNYTKLRDSLPKLDIRLIDLFTWATDPIADPTELAKRIHDATLWEVIDIRALISSKNFGTLSPSDFKNEVNLIKLQKALDVSTKIGMPIDSLFQWAKPHINFWKLLEIANGIRTAIRALYKLSDWEVTIKPTYDQLRQLQSDALTTHLINQPTLKEQEVYDADSLFEFLLIDTQMCPCVETSRLKQATSTVQLFIQRCFLDLEKEKYNITASTLDRDRWSWMQKYRVWEANRKVFLYPENWIQPSLRDDKSPIYMQLESELMQRDLSSTSMIEAMKNFLFGLEEVSNLEVDAIYVEDDVTPGDLIPGKNDGPNERPPEVKPREFVKIHFFARTRGAPYKFYYRTFTNESKAWSPWQDMTVDIPRYEIEKEKKAVGTTGPVAPEPAFRSSGGCYVVPFTFNSRLLLAVPQFIKVQLPAPVPENMTAAEIGNNESVDVAAPEEYWEIKMGLSELRNGKWTAKFITSDSIAETTHPKPLPLLGQYQFVVRDTHNRNSDTPSVVIDCFRIWPGAEDPVMNPDATVSGSRVGMFSFTGSHFAVEKTQSPTATFTGSWSDFHFQFQRMKIDEKDETEKEDRFRIMKPIQSGREKNTLIHEEDVFVAYPTKETDRSSWISYDSREKKERMFHPFVGTMLERLGNTDSLDSVFQYLALPNPAREVNWQQKQHLPVEFKKDAYGASQVETKMYNELTRPYALYNWEVGFHAPIAIADRLLQNQQFDLALKMMHYVFDPLSDQPGLVKQRVWRWLPFREANPAQNIHTILAALRPNTADSTRGQIFQWRERPFEPHVVARLRPTAYMKFVVKKYISILIAYGDYYFRQNTLETIPMAIQLYVLASHIYGPPGQKIPKRGKKRVKTYRSLLDKWDAFSNAMVQMEILFPFSVNQIRTELGKANGVEGLANIFGFASTGYFCIPDNPELRSLRTTIDDRLFKIRHCQDINGIERKLPLYEPPIDPALLVAATAAGLSLSSVLNDLNAPLPNFRFKYLLSVALDMCEHLRRLGKAFVLAKEKRDAEALLELKQRHETIIHQTVIEQKKLARDEAQKAADSLVQARKQPEYRMKHTLKLLGEDLGSIPTPADIESEFKEVVDVIEAPVVESGLKLVAAEKEELEKLVKSLDMKPIMNTLETLASELHLLPTLNSHASPFGVGIASCWGIPNIARGIQGAAKAYSAVAGWIEHQSQNISKVQSLVKQKQVRTKEANTAGHEIKHIDQQIVTQKVRVAAHDADIAAQEATIAHAQETHEFLTAKYTGVELYSWTEQQLSNLYYQSYTVTYDMAKKAEMAFRYERGILDSGNPPPFIRFGYWEPRNDGLLSGERMYLSLKELESAYHSTRGHDFEVTKHVSLRSVNPFALFSLRANATASFAVPEVLFDMDFPGHYSRRIKTVSLSIHLRSSPDSVPDPYTQANCTLRLLTNKFRTSPFVRSTADYPEKTDADDERFTAVSHVPISAIAASSTIQDSGLFEVKFDGERFLPFEGAGAISTWRLEFHDAFRSLDLDEVDDVILHLSYTAKDGGRSLGGAASKAVMDYIKEVKETSDPQAGGGLFAVFDIPRDFPDEFAAARDGQPGQRTMTLRNLNKRLPVYTRGTKPNQLSTQDVYIATDVRLPPGDVSIRVGGTALGFSKADGVLGSGGKEMNAVHSTDGPVGLGEWAVGVGEGVVHLEEMLILVRYTMG